MQPLKRFTQCASLTTMFCVFIVLFGVSSSALTTFGKASPNIPPPTPPPAKARECFRPSDCTTLQNTTCVRDPHDGKMRCLCGNNKASSNGQCHTKYNKLRHQCTESIQCEEGLICTQANSTATITKGTNTTITKLCLCDLEGGYTENLKDYTCNDAFKSAAGQFLLCISITLGILIKFTKVNV